MSDRLFERAISDWMETGSDRTPPAAIDAVLLAVKTTPQERDLRIPRRFNLMPLNTRLAAAIALAATIGVGAFAFIGGPPGPAIPSVSPPSASPAAPPPTTSPTRLGVDTSDWIAYTSERYGFDIKRGPDWTEEQRSERTWVLADAVDHLSPAAERFYGERIAGQGVGVSVWSVAVEPGTTLEAWYVAYCEATGFPCPGRFDRAVATTMDGNPAITLAGPTEDSQGFALVDDRVYIVSAWRPDNDPSVAPYGGGRKLVEAYMSTMTLRPGGPVPDVAPPALPKSFTSTMHGYSLDFPDAWGAIAATPGDPSDYFRSGPGTGALRVASAVIPAGESPDAWIDATLIPAEGECGPTRATLSSIVVDGHEGKIRTSCGEVEATVVVDDRVYVFTLFVGDGVGGIGDPFSVAGGRALFEAILATVQLSPDDAQGEPSGAPS